MTQRLKNTLAAPILLAAGLILFGALTWVFYQYSLNNPGGSDFIPRWLGTRMLITEGLNPYSDEATLRIQMMIHGHPAGPGEDQVRMAYPLYSALVFLPYALIGEFAMARAVYSAVLVVGLILMTFISLRLVNWRVGLAMLTALLLFSVFWYHALRSVINGNAVALIALGLAGGLLAVRKGWDELAGVLFALTTIKPHVVLMVLAFVLLWAISRRRLRLAAWTVGTVALLSVGAALVIPNWILLNLRDVMLYPGYTAPGTPRDALNALWPTGGAALGTALSAVTTLVMLVEWWKNRSAGFPMFLWTACLTLAASQWSGIQTDPGNFIILFPAVMLIFALLDRRGRGGRALVIAGLVGLMVGLWAIFLATLETANGQPAQSPLMFFPLPALVIAGLYGVKKWVEDGALSGSGEPSSRITPAAE